MCCFLWGQRWCRREDLSVFLALTWSDFQNLVPNSFLIQSLNTPGAVFAPGWGHLSIPLPEVQSLWSPQAPSLVLNSTWGWKMRSKWKSSPCSLCPSCAGSVCFASWDISRKWNFTYTWCAHLGAVTLHPIEQQMCGTGTTRDFRHWREECWWKSVL